MDISFWKNLSKDIEITYTSKQFYKQYFYKLEVWAPGCKSIHAEDIQRDIDIRNASTNPKYSYGGSWRNVRLQGWLSQVEMQHLTRLQYIKDLYPDVKIRTEEPKVQIYAESEQILKDIVNDIDSKYHKHILNFSGPENQDVQNLLETNKVLVKNKPNYQFKVILREKKYSSESRQQILNYLDNLGDLIKIPEGTRDLLSKSHGWMWGCYFYTNDPGVVDFVRLINPDIIREVCERVYVENK